MKRWKEDNNKNAADDDYNNDDKNTMKVLRIVAAVHGIYYERQRESGKKREKKVSE